MRIKEEDLSADLQAVLSLMREEMAQGRLTPEQYKLMEELAILKGSAVIVAKFFVWFGGLLIAASTVWSYVKVYVQSKVGG